MEGILHQLGIAIIPSVNCRINCLLRWKSGFLPDFYHRIWVQDGNMKDDSWSCGCSIWSSKTDMEKNDRESFLLRFFPLFGKILIFLRIGVRKLCFLIPEGWYPHGVASKTWWNAWLKKPPLMPERSRWCRAISCNEQKKRETNLLQIGSSNKLSETNGCFLSLNLQFI